MKFEDCIVIYRNEPDRKFRIKSGDVYWIGNLIYLICNIPFDTILFGDFEIYPFEPRKFEFEGYVLDCQGGLNNPEAIIAHKRRTSLHDMPYKKYKITMEELPND